MMKVYRELTGTFMAMSSVFCVIFVDTLDDGVLSQLVEDSLSKEPLIILSSMPCFYLFIYEISLMKLFLTIQMFG